MRVADHIKHLERIIENGELLRDQMRRTAEAREAIIRSQAGKLKQLSEINTLYKNRRNRVVMRLQKARNEIKLVEAKLKKQIQRYDQQDAFYAAIKAAANEIGIWKLLVEKAKTKLNANES
ncbi:TPA: hypothetical protein ISA30_004600 [Escherichia coli]|nr:hypothetical protein [Escherichia coli]EGC2509054.1 hypothetical protein [Escherichia coli]HAP1808181.1 hypothetical protein [Escherichia coli]HBN7253573.1 hypothetical protein [Escherichia coli]HDO7500589.1 hypothetical protein [Escherichia coli]